MQQVAIDLALHRRQGDAFQSSATEILYGGAAGGGKSHLMRVAAIVWCAQIPGLQVYLFRRIKDDLVKNHIEGPKGLRALLAPWVNAKLVEIIEDEIKFWNGSKIYLCHCKDEKDRWKYLGAEIHVLLIDELTTFTDVIYRFLRSRVRAVGLNLSAAMKGLFPRILCGSNPGGIGHHWVKAAFIDGAQAMELREMGDSEGGMRRQYIPAKLADNPSMAADDPNYRARLRGLGSPALIKAMEEGDWNIVAGAFFAEFSTARHVIAPFTIPNHWVRLRAADWGSAKPFSIGWYAVSDGTTSISRWDGWSEMPGPLTIPRGALVKYREWYGMQPGQPNVGLKLTAEKVADGIRERELVERDSQGRPVYEKIDFSVLDPAAFAQHGGPSIAERMADRKVYFHHADNARIAQRGAMGGWDLLRQRLEGAEDGLPMLYFFSTCTDTIRTIPALQHDEHKAEDVDSDGEDHCFSGETLVSTECGPKPISSLVGTSGFVASRDGLRAYRSCRLTRRNARVVRVSFEDGFSVVCTPDHRFMTASGDWKIAEDLLDETCYAARLWSRLSVPRFRNSKASGFTSAAFTFSAKVFGCIERFGKVFTDQCPMDSMSIISTTTAPITSPATWGWSKVRSTSGTIPSSKASKRLTKSLLAQEMLRQSGTEARKAGSGIVNTTRSICESGWRVGLKRIASNAARFIQWLSQRLANLSSATRTVKPVRCVHVEELPERRNVYCLTVPDAGCFALANGLIVSNCGDETRYACAARPWVREERKPVNPKFPINQTFNELIAARRKKRLENQ